MLTEIFYFMPSCKGNIILHLSAAPHPYVYIQTVWITLQHPPPPLSQTKQSPWRTMNVSYPPREDGPAVMNDDAVIPRLE